MKWAVSTRMLVATVVSLAVALFVATVVSRVLLAAGYTRVVSGTVRALVQQPGELDRCQAQPATWNPVFGDLHLSAYDSNGTSANPTAPALSPDLLNEALTSPSKAASRLPGNHQLGAVVIRVADSGPCALVQVEWKSAWSRGSFMLFIFAIVASMVLGGVMLVSFVSLRPLNRRIESVRRAALEVGAATKSPQFESGDDELGHISRALQAAHTRIRADAAALDARRRELERHLSDVSHDLRTPLASLQLALEAVHTNAAPTQQPLVSAALQDVVYLSSLTANLGLASRLRDGQALRADEGFDLSALVERVAERCTFFARHKGIEFGCAVPERPVWVAAESVAVEQALRNVVDNAITYVDAGGHIALLLEVEGASFTITVADDGPGVAPTELPRLNERTFRSDAARQRDPRGSGLGLAITAEVCRTYGWALSFDAVEPRGLKVIISGRSTSSPQATT